MALRDEEKGLFTGEAKRASVFASPTAVTFAVVLVCGAFIGGSVVYAGGGSASTETPTVGSSVHRGSAAEEVHPTSKNVRVADTAADAAAAAASGDGSTEPRGIGMSEDDEQAVEDMTIAVEMQLKLFLAPFTNFSTTELLVRARDGLKAALASVEGDSSYEEELSVIVEQIDLDGNSTLAEGVKEVDAKDDPKWMNELESVNCLNSSTALPTAGLIDKIPLRPFLVHRSLTADSFAFFLRAGVPYAEAAGKGAARRLLGSGENDMNAMDYAANFATALQISMDKMMELFPRMSSGVEDAMAAIVAKGDDATTQERLVLAAMDLSAVSARAAPEPFGKGVDVVFDTAWTALLEVLANVDVAAMKDLF